MEGIVTGVPVTEAVGMAAPEVEKTMNALVAIDDSDESFHALRWAIDYILKRIPVAAAAESRVVTVVHVMEPLPRYAISGVNVESAKQNHEQNAARILSRAFEICREKSLNAKTLILEGDPKDKICRAVEEMSIDLLVVGSRGLGQIKRALLGSVSDYCIHHAKCPVLLVKPPIKGTP
ncbi:uncharacterized protein LOC127251933 [Andrographis paniculata]|uniref:uncharacterized protein LOC127251933 n=1 Tax=Andrographis paniculata TaxID=175694 RepID=UPI0021E95659|nr:uncharacterized protein LOC127251933 [Andrographis paniculata]